MVNYHQMMKRTILIVLGMVFMAAGSAGCGHSAMYQAAYRNDDQTIKDLTGSGVSTNYLENNRTPLYVAVSRQNSKAVQALLDGGADPAMQNTRGYSALMLATEHGFTENVAAMLAKHPRLDGQNLKGETALHLAIENGCEPVVRLLVQAGARTDIKGPWGLTPMDMAEQRGIGPVLRNAKPK